MLLRSMTRVFWLYADRTLGFLSGHLLLFHWLFFQLSSQHCTCISNMLLNISWSLCLIGTFGIKSDSAIQDVVDQLCYSFKAIPAEVFEHSNSISSSVSGHVFFADVLCWKWQKICLARDVHSSFTTASAIHDKTADSLCPVLSMNTVKTSI